MKAISDYNFPPFIAGSCRREPDFENDFPSITSLCRQEKFAPLLFPNDVVVYITVKGDHYRLYWQLRIKKKTIYKQLLGTEKIIILIFLRIV